MRETVSLRHASKNLLELKLSKHAIPHGDADKLDTHEARGVERKMPDPFELWLLAWQSAVSHGMEQLIEAIPGAAALPDWRGRAEVVDLSALPVLGRVRTDLPTMLLLEQRSRRSRRKRRSSSSRPTPFTTPQ